MRLLRTALIVALSSSAFGPLEAAGPGEAEAMTLAAAKATFVHSFSRFVEWPADALAPSQALSICVIGDNAVADALEQIGRMGAGGARAITVRITRVGMDIRSCHVLYVTGLDARRSVNLFVVLKDAAVFTVSDDEGFAERGGVARLILDGNRMRFAINMTSAQRAHLNLSSRLLSLAELVKDGPDAHP
jgi:hypothetical protein